MAIIWPGMAKPKPCNAMRRKGDRQGWRWLRLQQATIIPIALLAVAGLTGSVQAAPYCTRLLPDDPAAPPGLAGHYQLVGKDPVTGQAYTGQLDIMQQGNAYPVRRTVKGQSVNGTAWMESCGPDRIKILRLRYALRPQAWELSCFARKA